MFGIKFIFKQSALFFSAISNSFRGFSFKLNIVSLICLVDKQNHLQSKSSFYWKFDNTNEFSNSYIFCSNRFRQCTWIYVRFVCQNVLEDMRRLFRSGRWKSVSAQLKITVDWAKPWKCVNTKREKTHDEMAMKRWNGIQCWWCSSLSVFVSLLVFGWHRQHKTHCRWLNETILYTIFSNVLRIAAQR